MRFWIISTIARSLLGAASVKWVSDTRAGNWCYDKFDSIADWASDRYGLDVLDKENVAWRSKYPSAAAKMDELELRIIKLERK